MLQTNPRGVEGLGLIRRPEKPYCYRRTLVGLKGLRTPPEAAQDTVTDEPSWG